MPCLLPPSVGDAGPVHPAVLDPWEAAANWGDGLVMAVLTATHGPAYRNAGAAMTIAPDGSYAGTLTSGCIEADLLLRADALRAGGESQHLRYGEGSPFFDLRLPCGGAIEVQLFALRDQPVLQHLASDRQARRPVSLLLTREGRLIPGHDAGTAPEPEGFRLSFRPALRFLVFGTGAEASAFAGILRGMDYEHLLLSHEEVSLSHARMAGSPVQHITALSMLDQLPVDENTAVVLFYHDHDYEPEILKRMIRGPAFFIGAQGSRATQSSRLARLEAMGLAPEALSRIRGPIGLIPSSRDPRALAISVLAEVVGTHGHAGAGTPDAVGGERGAKVRAVPLPGRQPVQG